MQPAEQNPEGIPDNREEMTERASRAGLQLSRAPPHLQDDREFVLAAVTSKPLGPFNLPFASYRLKQDRGVSLAAMRANGEALEFALPQFQVDREVVLEAVAGQNGHPAALRFASNALEFASPELRGNLSVVLAATRRSPEAVRHSTLPEQVQKEVLAAADSKIAEQGEKGTMVATVFLEAQEYVIKCTALLALAGRSLEFYMDEEASVGDLAVEVVDRVPADMQAVERVTLLISSRHNGESDLEESIRMTPWHCNMPLAAYAAAGLRRRNEEASI